MAVASLHHHRGNRVLTFPVLAVEKARAPGRRRVSIGPGLAIELVKMGGPGAAAAFKVEEGSAASLAELAATIGMASSVSGVRVLSVSFKITSGSIDTIESESTGGVLRWSVGPPEGGGVLGLWFNVAARRVDLHEFVAGSFDKWLRQLTGMAPETPRQRGFRLRSSKDAEGARAAFEESLALDAADASAWLELSQLHHKDRGDREAALIAAAKVLEIASDSGDQRRARLLRAACFEELGRRDEAIAEIDAAIASELDTTGNTHLRRGQLLVNAGRAAEALADLEIALQKGVFNAKEVHLVRAAALRLLGREEEAREADARAEPADFFDRLMR
jgi:hypothetical protein